MQQASSLSTLDPKGRPLKLTRRATTLGGLGLLATSAILNKASAFDGPLTDLVEGTEDFGTAVDAYTYGYPMVTLEMTRRRLTNVTKADETRAPMGQIVKMRSYPDASYRDITGPNADTLYTTAFFDVGDEPWVLSAPDMKGRYFMLPFLDGWTSVFAVPGSRTTGTQAQTFLITGPGWSGTVPAGMTQLESKTSLVWLIGRIYCTGTPEDYAEVHALQDQFKLQPLSSWGKDYTPPPGEVDPSVDMKTPTRDQVNGLSAVKFFTLLADLLKRNPPYAADAPALARFKAIGLVPGQSFDGAHLDALWDRRLPQVGYDWILAHLPTLTRVNGWLFTTKTGLYGTDYTQRALIAAVGLGANRPQDAVYPLSTRASILEAYEGAYKYEVRFEKGELPPVKGFWSLTLYDEHMFFVANPINRYAMSLRTHPKFEADGSLVIYIQNESPGPDRQANWLPAPKGGFRLMMRLYWPEENTPSILDGSWVLPAVTRVG